MMVVCDTAKVRVFKQITTGCARETKFSLVVCDTAKVRVFKQITTCCLQQRTGYRCLRYCKSTSFQANHNEVANGQKVAIVVCDTAKVRVFKQITTTPIFRYIDTLLFAILQKYEFSSKSQQVISRKFAPICCLRYCKSTSFQANHNYQILMVHFLGLFAILQKYEFSSKSQLIDISPIIIMSCLRYCKSTSFQANHNTIKNKRHTATVVCDTAKVRVFKQITTCLWVILLHPKLFAILQKYEFSSKSQPVDYNGTELTVVCDTAKVRVFKQITTIKASDFKTEEVVCDTAKVRVFKQITTRT